MQQIDIGIAPPQRQQIVEGLARFLADTYTLYLTTHAFHWNVTGPMFSTLHQLFEDQYTELWGAVDNIAERIRSLGAPAPGSYAEFAGLTSIPPTQGIPGAMDMVSQLLHGHEAVIRTARAVLPVADQAHDEATVDLLTDRLRTHEKMAWMLRSLLD